MAAEAKAGTSEKKSVAYNDDPLNSKTLPRVFDEKSAANAAEAKKKEAGAGGSEAKLGAPNAVASASPVESSIGNDGRGELQVGLKEENDKLKKENTSLKAQIEKLTTEKAELEKLKSPGDSSVPAAPGPNPLVAEFLDKFKDVKNQTFSTKQYTVTRITDGFSIVKKKQ